MTVNSFDIVKRAGIGKQQIDEVVGTGDNTETSFDLDNDRIIDGSYTLSYAGSGSNDFTDLTDVTHYAIDKDSGRILLTTAGKTALSTNILYANYTYLDNDSPLNDTIIADFGSKAEERVRELTGRAWGSTTITEYQDGFKADSYPRTDRPFSNIRQRWDYVQIDEFPVNSISEIWFLDRNAKTFGEVYVYDSSLTSYTDETEDAEDPDESFYPLNTVPASNDALYVGLGTKFLGLWTVLNTVGTDAGSLAVTWEYYNGSSWTALSNVTAATTNGELFLADSNVYWDWPKDWEETTVNGVEAYYVRGRLSAGSFTVVPIALEIYPDTDRVINQNVSVRRVSFTRTGRVTFIGTSIPEGINNVRIKYVGGVLSTDKYYNLGVDLMATMGAAMCFVSMSGGSYDDETSFTIGSKAVTVGEVYVNIREVLSQLKSEKAELLSAVGSRSDISG